MLQFASSKAPAASRAWLRRRPGYLLGAPIVEGEVDLVLARLEWAFWDLRFFLAFASTWLIGNAW